MINKLLYNNLFIILFGSLIIFIRIFNSFNGLGFTFIEFIIGLIAITVVIFLVLKKAFSKLILLALFILASIIVPFEYLYGVINYRINKQKMEEIVKNFHNGDYDSLIKLKKHPNSGVNIGPDNNTRLYSDSSLDAVFFMLNFDKTKEEYDGILYISKDNYISDRKIYSLLRREFKYKKLESNWFWVYCYIDRTPAP